MSTLEATPQPNRRRTRFRTGLLALGALIAIGAAAVILALSDSNHATNPHATVGGAHVQPHTAAAVPSAAPAGHFRDPTTHAHLRGPHAGRNPTLAFVLSTLTPQERHYVLGIMSLNPTQLRAAYGTVN
jgi:hypothetical protein